MVGEIHYLLYYARILWYFCYMFRCFNVKSWCDGILVLWLLNKGNASQNYNLSLPNGNYLLLIPSDSSVTTNNIVVSSGSYNVSVPANSFSVLVYNYPSPADSVSISGK